MSTPALDAIKQVATPLPLVSWVCRCIGVFTFSFNAFIKLYAACGFNKPAISFIHMISVPNDSNSCAKFI